MPFEQQFSVQGSVIGSTSQRARVDPTPGDTCTVYNYGPGILEHSANSDGTSPKRIAVHASGTVTASRWLRSQSRSNGRVVGGRIEGVVV